MQHLEESPGGFGAPGFPECSLLGGVNSQDPIETLSKFQARNCARRKYVVARLHALGPAPLAYFLAEIEGGADIRGTLETYAALPAEFIAAFGGDRFAQFLILAKKGVRFVNHQSRPSQLDSPKSRGGRDVRRRKRFRDECRDDIKQSGFPASFLGRRDC